MIPRSAAMVLPLPPRLQAAHAGHRAPHLPRWVRAAADPKVLAVIVLSILLALLVRDLGGLLGSLGAWGYAGAFAISAA